MTAKEIAEKLLNLAKLHSEATGMPLADSLLLIVEAVAKGNWRD